MRHIIILTLIFSLTACGWRNTPPPTVVTPKVEVHFIEIPSELLTDCVVSEPPEEETYINSTVETRETFLADYIKDLLQDIKVCRDKISAIKAFQKSKTKQPLKEQP